jgi:hypothetical protein
MENYEAARLILKDLKARVAAGSREGLYGHQAEALRDLESIHTEPSIEKIRFLLAPTANLQELAMANGWGAEFNELAAHLEKLLGIP